MSVPVLPNLREFIVACAHCLADDRDGKVMNKCTHCDAFNCGACGKEHAVCGACGRPPAPAVHVLGADPRLVDAVARAVDPVRQRQQALADIEGSAPAQCAEAEQVFFSNGGKHNAKSLNLLKQSADAGFVMARCNLAGLLIGQFRHMAKDKHTSGQCERDFSRSGVASEIDVAGRSLSYVSATSAVDEGEVWRAVFYLQNVNDVHAANNLSFFMRPLATKHGLTFPLRGLSERVAVACRLHNIGVACAHCDSTYFLKMMHNGHPSPPPCRDTGTTGWCSKCGFVRYCNEYCRQKHAATHKRLCEARRKVILHGLTNSTNLNGRVGLLGKPSNPTKKRSLRYAVRLRRPLIFAAKKQSGMGPAYVFCRLIPKNPCRLIASFARWWDDSDETGNISFLVRVHPKNLLWER